MVNPKELIATLILCSLAGGVQANDGCTAGSEFEPSLCPLDLPRIDQIILLRNGAAVSAAGPTANCAAFHLTPRQVRRYLAHAKAVDATDAHHTLDRSPCFAAGELIFSDGRRGEWFIEQFRAGTVKIGPVEPQLVYCRACRFRPFRW